MAPSLIHEPIRKLPLWQDGFARGLDVGLVIALSAITSERAHQEQLGDRDDAGSPAARVYADGVLSSVARVLAGRFRQTT
jgi:hypothetical protein